MMLLVLGVLFFIISLLFFFAPGLIARLNECGERLLFTDKGAVKHHVKSGIFFLAASILILVCAVIAIK